MKLFLIHFSVYWILSGFYYILDTIIDKNKTVEYYKQNKIDTRYWKYCHDSIKGAIINQLFITLPVILLINDYVIINCKYYFILELLKLLFYTLCIDIWFFHLHYAFHLSPTLYKI